VDEGRRKQHALLAHHPWPLRDTGERSSSPTWQLPFSCQPDFISGPITVIAMSSRLEFQILMILFVSNFRNSFHQHCMQAELWAEICCSSGEQELARQRALEVSSEKRREKSKACRPVVGGLADFFASDFFFF
jgi:hypothetical protein